MSPERKGRRVRIKGTLLIGRLTGKSRTGYKFPAEVKQGQQYFPDFVEVETPDGNLVEVDPNQVEKLK